MMKKILAVILLLALLIGGWFWSVSMQPDTTLRIDNPRIRLLPGDRPLAGYFTIHNAGDSDLQLLGASSEAFGRIMIHATIVSNGQSKMEEQTEAISVPAGDTIKFAPGGLHLMMMQKKRDLNIGDEAQVVLSFIDADAQPRTIEVPFTVVPVQPQ